MEVGRILNTLGLETKGFVTCDTIHIMIISIFVLVPLVFKCNGDNTDGPKGCLHVQWVTSQLRNTELGEPTNFTAGSKQSCSSSRRGRGVWKSKELLPRLLRLSSA